jgi:hypothetical protein
MQRNILGFARARYYVFLALVISLCGVSFALADIVSQSFSVNSSNDVTITQLTIDRPDSVVIGDLLLANISFNGGNMATVTPPTGWTQILRTDNDTNVGLISYRKIAGAIEPDNYTWTIDHQTTAEGGVIRYTGVDAINPIDAYSGNSGYGIVATTTSITTNSANDEIVTLFATDVGKNTDAGVYFSEPLGTTEKYDVSNTPFGPSTAADEMIQTTIGGTGSKSSTITGNKQRNWVAQQIALRKLPVVPTVNGAASIGVNEDTGPLASSITFSHTVDPGNNQVLIVTMGAEGSGEDTSATYNGISMIKGNPHGAGDSEYYDYWYLLNPPVGTHDVIVNFPPAAGRHYGAVTISNVNQTTPFDTGVHVSGSDFSSAANVRATIDVTTTETNELILYFLDFGGNNNTYVPDDPQLYSALGGYANTGATRVQPSAGVVTVGGTISRTFGGSVWELIAVPIRPAN